MQTVQYHSSTPTIPDVPFPARTAWPGVELRHLIALQAVVAAGSFNGAAARLGYTQSAVSAQIRALERSIGVRVLDRSRGARTIGLTKEGLILLRYATEIVARFEAAAAHLVGRAPATNGELRVGSFRSASLALAAPAVARLARAHPEVRTSILELGHQDVLLDFVADGELELAFAVAPIRKGFASTMLRREGYVAVVAPDDELATRAEIELADLAGRRVFADTTSHDALVSQPNEVAEVTVIEDATLVAALGAAGAGIAILPELSHVAAEGAVVLPVRGDLPQRSIVLAWHDERPRSVAALQFIRAVTSVAHRDRARAA
jgi:DNA-binding transcriptional LysR family regulator